MAARWLIPQVRSIDSSRMYDMPVKTGKRAVATADDRARRALHSKYRDRIEVNPSLTRALVSYQSNRDRRYYRWFKYKEGFSASLVEYLLDKFTSRPGEILATAFSAQARLALRCTVTK